MKTSFYVQLFPLLHIHGALPLNMPVCFHYQHLSRGREQILRKKRVENMVSHVIFRYLWSMNALQKS